MQNPTCQPLESPIFSVKFFRKNRCKNHNQPSETGFYYLQSRYYDPIVKRFLNADALYSTATGFLGYNMFAYCNNQPTNTADTGGSRPYNVNVGMTDGPSHDPSKPNPLTSTKYGAGTGYYKAGYASYSNEIYEYEARSVANVPEHTPIGTGECLWPTESIWKCFSINSTQYVTVGGKDFKIIDGCATAYLQYSSGEIVCIKIYNICTNQHMVSYTEAPFFDTAFDELKGYLDSMSTLGGGGGGVGIDILHPVIK